MRPSAGMLSPASIRIRSPGRRSAGVVCSQLLSWLFSLRRQVSGSRPVQVSPCTVPGVTDAHFQPASGEQEESEHADRVEVDLSRALPCRPEAGQPGTANGQGEREHPCRGVCCAGHAMPPGKTVAPHRAPPGWISGRRPGAADRGDGRPSPAGAPAYRATAYIMTCMAPRPATARRSGGRFFFLFLPDWRRLSGCQGWGL